MVFVFSVTMEREYGKDRYIYIYKDEWVCINRFDEMEGKIKGRDVLSRLPILENFGK